MTPQDAAQAGANAALAWLPLKGIAYYCDPYRGGGKPVRAPTIDGATLVTEPRGIDCSGLVQLGWTHAGIWPFHGEASASSIWTVCPRVAWADRRAGDVVCFGANGACHHVVGVVTPDEFIGANHGAERGEHEDEAVYVQRMKAADEGRGARVVTCGSDYWSDARLGVVRAPSLTY